MITQLQNLLLKLHRLKINNRFLERVWDEWALNAIEPETLWLLKMLCQEWLHQEFKPDWEPKIPVYHPRINIAKGHNPRSRRNRKKLTKYLEAVTDGKMWQLQELQKHQRKERREKVYLEQRRCQVCNGRLLIRINHRPPRLALTYFYLYWLRCTSCKRIWYDKGTQVNCPLTSTQRQFNDEWWSSFGRMTEYDVYAAIEEVTQNQGSDFEHSQKDISIEQPGPSNDRLAAPRS